MGTDGREEKRERDKSSLPYLSFSVHPRHCSYTTVQAFFQEFYLLPKKVLFGSVSCNYGWSKILFQFFHRLLQKTQIKFLARPIKESQTKYSPEEIQKSFHPKSRSKLGFPLPSITMNATCDREQTTS